MRPDLFYPSYEGEGRLLLLIDTFTTQTGTLEGRTKLAKLDFFVRYPQYLSRALRIRRGIDEKFDVNPDAIEQRMVRYRFGPWDPSYFNILGRLIGRGLVETVPTRRGIAYRTTTIGRETALHLAAIPIWQDDVKRMRLLKQHFNLTGTTLKQFIYDHFPEVSKATWGEEL